MNKFQKIKRAKDNPTTINPYEKGTREAINNFRNRSDDDIVKQSKEEKAIEKDLTKAFGFSLKRSTGEYLKARASETPITASKLLNDFIEKELDNYMEQHWGR